MLTFPHPITLIMIAGGSSSERQMLKKSVSKQEYVFVETDNIYKCLDIAECHRPECVIIYFSIIENNHRSVFQFLKFLDIPIILIADNLSENQRQYFLDTDIFAVIKAKDSPFELEKNLVINLGLIKQNQVKENDKNLSFDLVNTTNNENNKLQNLISNAIEIAISKMSEMIACEIQSQGDYSEAMSPMILGQKLQNILDERLVCVAQLDFNGDFAGCAQILFSAEASENLVLALGGDDIELDERNQFKADMMAEIGNVAINSVIGTLSNSLNYRVNYIAPVYKEGSVDDILDLINLNFNSTIILSRTHFKIKEIETEGDLLLFFQARLLLDILFNDEKKVGVL